MVRKLKYLFSKHQIKEAKRIALYWAFQKKQKEINCVSPFMWVFAHKVRIGG